MMKKTQKSLKGQKLNGIRSKANTAKLILAAKLHINSAIASAFQDGKVATNTCAWITFM